MEVKEVIIGRKLWGRFSAAKVLLALLAVWTLAGTVQGANVLLDKGHQGGGNKGTAFRPIDESGLPAVFELTAHTLVDSTLPFDPNASFQTGTVHIQDGAGVQLISGGGSMEISGAGTLANEDLIFTFDNPISVEEIILGLIHVDFGSGPGHRDDPVIFLSSAADPGVFEHVVMEAEIQDNFTPTGGQDGRVDFSGFTMLPLGTLIDSFMVRETNAHIAVNLFVPEPATLFLLALGGLMVIRHRFDRT